MAMNEFELIEAIAKGQPRKAEGLLQGINDDTAVIDGPEKSCWLVTTDIFSEGIHFERSWTDWLTLGEKALLVNISDVVAMGGTPWFYLVSIGCPSNMSPKEIKELFSGMRAVADQFDMVLIGGDTAASNDQLSLSVTVIGRMEKHEVIYRHGAKPKDKIYVTGTLGASTAGLTCLQEGITDDVYQNLIERHLLPEIRVDLARWLAQNHAAHAMIDISDGLIADLTHIADRSQVGFRLHADRVLIEETIYPLARDLKRDALQMALTGGEEYELLFTMSPEQETCFTELASQIDFGCPITCIGEITNDIKDRHVLNLKGEEINIDRSGFVHKIGS